MRFNVVLVDPPGYRYAHFLHYFCKLLRAGFETLGHECVLLRNRVERDGLTVLVGGHLLRSPEMSARLVDSAPYVVLQTEVLRTAKTLWAGYESTFVPLLRRANAVWEVLPENLDALRTMGVQAEPLLGGYDARLCEIPPKRAKDIDFLFVGTPTAHRTRMLQRLSERGRSIAAVFDEPALIRDDLIARSRVHLSMRTDDGFRHLPWPRICELLNNGGLVVSERCEDQEWLEDCFVTADTDAWADACEETLARSDREELRAANFERFKARPFTERLARVLTPQLLGMGAAGTPAASRRAPMSQGEARGSAWLSRTVLPEAGGGVFVGPLAWEQNR